MDKFFRSFGLVFLLMLATFTTTAAAKFELGKEYTELPKSLANDPLVAMNNKQGKVVVTEFFSYACPACNAVAPSIREWAASLPQDVVFQRVPVEFHKEWGIFARAFYTAEALGMLDKIDKPIFDAVHQKRLDLYSEESMQKFFVEQGASAEAFSKAFKSFSVDKSIERAKMLMRSYKVFAVPAVIVDNHYTTDLQKAKSLDGFIAVIDHMIAEAKKKQ